MADEVRKSDTIASLLAEDRTFPPPAEFPPTPSSRTPRVYDEAEADSKASGPSRPARCSTGRAVGHRPRVGAAVREVVRRRQAQRRRTTASTATSTPATATRSRSTGRASPATPAPSPTPSCSTRSRRLANVLQGARRREGRPGRHLPGHGPRAADRDARVRAHRRRRTRWSSAASPPTRSRDRINDAEAKVLITADGAWRRGQVVPLKAIADDALAETPDASSTSSCCGAPSTTSR